MRKSEAKVFVASTAEPVGDEIVERPSLVHALSHLTQYPGLGSVPWAQFAFEPNKRSPMGRELDFIIQMIDSQLLGRFEKVFDATDNHDFLWFVKTVINTGIYEAENITAFLAGCLNLFFDITRTQSLSATLRWKDIVDYFITSQVEDVEYTPDFCAKLFSKKHLEKPELQRASYSDPYKHHLKLGDKINAHYWPTLDQVVSCEEGSVCLWTLLPKLTQHQMKVRIPEMQVTVTEGGELCCDVDTADVTSVAYDGVRNIAALLTNKLFVIWGANPREPQRFIQKTEYQMECVYEDLWYQTQLGWWVTGDKDGLLTFFDLQNPKFDAKGRLVPNKVAPGHTNKVTVLLELGQNFFITASLDRTILMWDQRQLTVDTRKDDHKSAVLSVIFLPLYSLLISAGCEKLIYCWTIEGCAAFRGLRKRLAAHEHNLVHLASAAHAFFSLDEASIVRVWDAATLIPLIVFGGYPMQVHRILVVPTLGRVILVGKRFQFFECNDQLSQLLRLTREDAAEDVVERENTTGLDCAIDSGVNDCNATVYHIRSRSIELYPAAGGTSRSVTVKIDMDDHIVCGAVGGPNNSLFVIGTSFGTILFTKFRSGYCLQAYLGINASPAASKIEPPKPRIRKQNAVGDDQQHLVSSGLSARITCAAMSSTRAFVGTVEGDVILFRLDEDITIEARLEISCNDPIASIVIDEELGLMIVGTKDGLIQVYGIESRKFLSSFNLRDILEFSCYLRGIRLVGEYLICLMTGHDRGNESGIWQPWIVLKISEESPKTPLIIDSENYSLIPDDIITVITSFGCDMVPFISNEAATQLSTDSPDESTDESPNTWTDDHMKSIPRIETTAAPRGLVDFPAAGLVYCGFRSGMIEVIQLPHNERLHSWKAHSHEIQSLTTSLYPPSIVSMDNTGRTCIWSTVGELWASVNGLETDVWPPPQVAGLHQFLMTEARRIADLLHLKVTNPYKESKSPSKTAPKKGSAGSSTATFVTRVQWPGVLEQSFYSAADSGNTYTPPLTAEEQHEGEEESVERMASPFTSEEPLPYIRKTISAGASAETKNEKKKIKRKVSSTRMTTLCQQHAFSTMFEARDVSLIADPIQRVDRLHPIDRHAYAPVDRRFLYEAGLQRVKKKAMSKSTSAPSLMEQAVSTTDLMREYVNKEYKFDITKFDLKTIRKPSFVRSQLDVGRITPFKVQRSMTALN